MKKPKRNSTSKQPETTLNSFGLIKLIILAILSYSSIVILVLIATSSKMNLPTKLMAGIAPAVFIIFIAFFFKKTFGNWKKAIRAFLLLLP